MYWVLFLLAFACARTLDSRTGILRADDNLRSDWTDFKSACPAATDEALFNEVHKVKAVDPKERAAVCAAITAAQTQDRSGFPVRGLTVGLELEIGWGSVVGVWDEASVKQYIDYDTPLADPKTGDSLAELNTDGCSKSSPGTCFFEFKTKPILIAECENAKAAVLALIADTTIKSTSFTDLLGAYNTALGPASKYLLKPNAVTGHIVYTYNKDGKPPTPQVNFAFPISKLNEPCFGNTLSKNQDSYGKVVHGALRAAVAEVVGSLAVSDEFKGLLYLTMYMSYAQAQVTMRAKKTGNELDGGMFKSQSDPLSKVAATDVLRMASKVTKLQWWRWLTTTTASTAASTLATALNKNLKAIYDGLGKETFYSVYVESEGSATFKEEATNLLGQLLRLMIPGVANVGRYPGETAAFYGNGVNADIDEGRLVGGGLVASGKPLKPQMITSDLVGVVLESRDAGTSLNSAFATSSSNKNSRSWRRGWNSILECAGLPTENPPGDNYDISEPPCEPCKESDIPDIKKWQFLEAEKQCRSKEGMIEATVRNLKGKCKCTKNTLCKVVGL